MSKRPLSGAQFSPSKRVHAPFHVTRLSHRPLTFDNSLYDELILCIFSHLDWIDLCVSQSTNKNWARLAADNELWKGQYMRVYGRTRLRGAKGFIGRRDGREVRPLPGRAVPEQLQFKDWKWMFRISYNWRTGRCAIEESTTHSHGQRMDDASVASDIIEKTHLLLAGPLIISATSLATDCPVVVVNHGGASRNQKILVPHNSSSSFVSITALALDQSPPRSGNLAIACFLCTGNFSVFEFNYTNTSNAIQTCSYRPSRTLPRGQGIIHAVFYHPLLATLSENFVLSIFDLSSGVPQLTQTLSSFTSYPPASLVLSCQTPGVFKLVISYTTPVYPNHWSIGATELIISNNPRGSPHRLASGNNNSLSFREDIPLQDSSAGMFVTSSRTIRAFDVPPGWVDSASLHTIREQWSRKLLEIADVQTDGKWVIVAPEDNHFAREQGTAIPLARTTSSTTPSQSVSSDLHSPTSLQLYRLVLPSANSVSSSPPKLNFVRMLHGQTSPISSLALADGRCVSLGRNGSIWVWDLEAGTGAEVAPADDTQVDHYAQLTQDLVSFDERRIVTARAGKVVVRRFDI